MEFETVERCGRIYVVKNGVESAEFARRASGRWAVMAPQAEFVVSIGADALDLIAAGMDTWYTVAQAAVRLVELGKTTRAPAAQTMYRWLRAGKFPGAIRCGVGRNRGWRIPETALRKFERKRGER